MPRPAETHAHLQPVEGWLRRHRPLVVAAIVVLSVVPRLIYFAQLNDGPCVWQHRWDQTDMAFFHDWAKGIAAGDWLTDRALHPFHRSHALLAEHYLQTYPDEARALVREAAAGDDRTPAELLWAERWYGGKQLHQEPLYPYLVALTYALFGDDVRIVFAWQMLLGVLSNLLIYGLARLYFGDTAGALAALLAVACAPLMYHDLVLYRASPRIFAGLAVVYATATALQRPRARRWLATGVVVGLAILLKSTFILYLLGLLGMLAWQYRRDPRTLRGAAGGVIAGVLVCLIPLVARNLAVGVSPLSMSSVGPIGFILINAEDWRPQTGRLHPAYKHASEILHESGGRMGPAVRLTLETHDGMASVISSVWGRFAMIWHWYEIPGNTNLYYYRLHAPVLGWLPIGFLLLAPLGILGMLVSWRRWDVCWPLYGLVATSLVSLTAFGALGRYRVPLLAAFAVFAAAAVVRLVEWGRVRRPWPLVAAAASLGILFFVIGRPMDASPLRPADFGAPTLYHYLPRAETAWKSGDHAGAAAVLRESLAIEPVVVQQMGPGRAARNDDERQLAEMFGLSHTRYARYLSRAGQPALALEHQRRGEELKRAAQTGR